MVTKRKSARRAAPRRRRTYAARRAAPRRRAKSGVTYIPSAMATAALVAVNVGMVKDLTNAITNKGRVKTPAGIIDRAYKGLMGQDTWINGKMKAMVSGNALVMDAVAVAGGYFAGEVVKKYAPNAIKKPLGKIAKKVPKVI